MREVKYRGLDVMTGQWLYGNLLITGTGLVYIVPQNLIGDLPFWQVDKDTVGQFTVLKDKNGVEIYEGDILSLRNKENKPYHMKVLWTGQGYGYEIIRNDTKRSGYIVGHLSERGLNFYNKTSEVIGNIYQHSELLEVQHDSK